MNSAANTSGVMYSPPWDLGLKTGKEFLHDSYDAVGRRYAQELLQHPQESVLHDYRGDLSNFQKALLQHLIQTTTKHDFDQALNACARHNVVSSGAAALFAPHAEIAPKNNVASNALSVPEMMDHDDASVASALKERVTDSIIQPETDLNLDDDDDDLMNSLAEDTNSGTRSRLAPLGRRGASQPALKLMPKRKKPKT